MRFMHPRQYFKYNMLSQTFLVNFLLFVLFVVHGHSGQTAVPSPELSRQMREYKTEVIRHRILSELPEPPAGLIPPAHIPQSVISLLGQKRVEESLLADGKNHIASPVLNGNANCWNESICSRYDFQLPSEDKPFSSMHIWLPRTTSTGSQLSISACFVTSPDDICDIYTNLTEVTSEIGGYILQIPARMIEGRQEQQYCTIEILGLPPSSLHPDLKPLLVSHFADPSRHRRSAATFTPSPETNCTCCLLKLEVNFTAIGLPWVVAPPTFYPNMCYGHCTVQLNNYPSHYHRMISTMKQSNPQLPSVAERNLWTPCCSPTKLSPFSMIYMAAKKENGTEVEGSGNETISFFYHKIPDMITESCGCW